MPVSISSPPRRRHLRRLVRFLLLAALVVGLVIVGYSWWTRRDPQPPTEIFRGVTYSCERLAEDPQGGGLMHWTRIDLSTPGLGLYATPLDAVAVRNGWQYQLKHAGAVPRENRLAVVVNGTLFQRGGLPVSGTFARASETVVATHQVSHIDPHSFLLWFEDDLTPHIEKTRPPPREALEKARWAIGGNLLTLSEGEVSRFAHTDKLEKRTLIGTDPARRLLWLVVIERASEKRAAEELKRLGATDGIALDGGSSTEMAIGPGAAGARPGSLIGTWMPTANHFGVQAERIGSDK